MQKRVSLKDIAKKAGVSIATVSYVLSKQKNSGVSQEVSDKIRKIAKELNYRPNQIAKSLQSGKSHTIGLIVADISNPFFAQIARIVEDEAKKNGYTVIFGSSDEKASKSGDLIKFLLNRQVDGFIIAPSEASENQLQQLKEQKVPFVLIDRYFPDIETNFVAIDNQKAAFDAVNRLKKNGKKRIGMIAYDTQLHHMKERVRGFKNAITAEEYQETLLQKVEFSKIKEGVPKAIEALLGNENSVDAIFFATNTLGITGLKYLNERNINVPEDVAVIVFDESEAFDFFYCPLTYVKQPLPDLAKKAVNVLVEEITKPSKNVSKINLDAELIVGNSCR
ncbi:substrate-binding domain-containing protein [Flagellimonas sp. HMM57]|uniref:LacI family DNA-binding transcriptional regulator n=1 Tax=unclassified Flagellimonas TaxID=2644544 RepID=UPI0013D14CC4|nr:MULTISPECIES: substrate-binding domain-containing protein [unclassified Flagellimonas]UII75394.1 substrate-binding domain-containing protein [Flagellimonas sp. HMM57]